MLVLACVRVCVCVCVRARALLLLLEHVFDSVKSMQIEECVSCHAL